MSHYDCKYCGCSPGEQHHPDCLMYFRNAPPQVNNNYRDQILEERLRQMMNKGYTPHHDDRHTHGELARAAASYALISAGNTLNADLLWPWSAPMRTRPAPRRALIIAAALIFAEIARLDRAEARAPVTEADIPF